MFSQLLVNFSQLISIMFNNHRPLEVDYLVNRPVLTNPPLGGCQLVNHGTLMKSVDQLARITLKQTKGWAEYGHNCGHSHEA